MTLADPDADALPAAVDDSELAALATEGGTPLDLPLSTGPGAPTLWFTLLVVAASFTVLWALRRGARFGGSQVLRPLGTCPLGPRRNATLLQVGSRVVLVGVCDGSVRRIGEWDESVLDDGDESVIDSAGLATGDTGQHASEPESPAVRFRSVAARLGRWLPGGVLALAGLFIAGDCDAQSVSFTLDGTDDWEPGRLTTVLEIAALLTAATLIPAAVLTASCFTRFVIVFHFVRQALGVPETPPNQVLVGLSLFLTAFVMAPVGEQAWQDGFEPYRRGEISAKDAAIRGSQPLKEFMLRNTRRDDLALVLRMADAPLPATREELSLRHLIPAYVISELNTAFTAGFLIFLPFLVIDMLVAAVLLSMGMMMMPPVMVSMPLKVMVFVLAGGWNLLVGAFVAGVK